MLICQPVQFSGSTSIGIIRANAVTEELANAPFAEISYQLVVPRSVLPEPSAANIADVKRLPMVLIDGDGQFVAAAERLIKLNKLPVEIVARVESFSLAIDMAKILGAATIVPKRAADEFSLETHVKPHLNGIERISRELVIVWSKKTAALNTRAVRAAFALNRIFAG